MTRLREPAPAPTAPSRRPRPKAAPTREPDATADLRTLRLRLEADNARKAYDKAEWQPRFDAWWEREGQFIRGPESVVGVEPDATADLFGDGGTR